MKYLTLLILLAGAGCSTCSDGHDSGIFRGPLTGGGDYQACSFKCCKPGRAQDCRCSTSCPCWRRHQ